MRLLMRLSLVLAALTVALAGPVDAKKPSCKKGKEQKGCKVAVGAYFSGDKVGGQDKTNLSQFKAKAWTLNINHHVIDCTSGNPRGRVDLFRPFTNNKSRLKVGKSYKTGYHGERTDPETGTTSSTDFKVNFTVKSAKTVSITVKYEDKINGQVNCGGGYTAKLKRTQ